MLSNDRVESIVPMNRSLFKHTKFIFSLKAELSEIREKSTIMGGRYRHNQLLEDLRHHQEKLSQEKKQWAQEKENLDLEMKTKKEELAKYQVTTALFKSIFGKLIFIQFYLLFLQTTTSC